MATALDCLLSAAQELSSAGSMKQRLIDAYARHISTLGTEDIPRELREDFSALEGSLCALRPMRGETAIQATVRKMSDRQAAHYAAQIIALFGAASRLQTGMRQPMLRAVNSGDD